MRTTFEKSSARLLLLSLLSSAVALICVCCGASLRAVFATLSVIVLSGVVWMLGFDYLDPLLAFVAPWAAISVFGTLELSQFAHPIDGRVYLMLASVEATAILLYLFAQRGQLITGELPDESVVACKGNRYLFTLFVFCGLATFNILLAGYVPIVRGIVTGDTGYLDFGTHGVYGLFNAFANGVGVLSFYLFLKKRRAAYLIVTIAVVLTFAIFVTRQNIVSLVIECFVLFTLIRHRIKLWKLAVGTCIALLLFSIAGSLRSGDIRELAAIRTEYQFVPEPFIWVYAYCYFNLLNLNNVVTDPSLPAYDGSSVASLVPSFLRPDVSHTDQDIEISQFNAFSFIAPVYADFGWPGLLLLTSCVSWWGARAYRQAVRDRSFYAVAKFAVLFYCALFSFFVNFWFYLPMIAQIPIFWCFAKYILQTEPPAAYLRERGQLVAKYS